MDLALGFIQLCANASPAVLHIRIKGYRNEREIEDSDYYHFIDADAENEAVDFKDKLLTVEQDAQLLSLQHLLTERNSLPIISPLPLDSFGE